MAFKSKQLYFQPQTPTPPGDLKRGRRQGCVGLKTVGKQTKCSDQIYYIPSQMCLKAKAAAAAVSSDVLMPLVRMLRTEANIDGSLDAASNHFEYAPMVKQTEDKR